MAFDKDKPASSTSLRASNPEILANWDALETALNREHEFSTGGTVADQAHHKRGSARAYFQDAAPGTRVDGTAFTSEDLGSLWFDSNSSPDNQFNVLTATTPTWTPISTEVIATLLAAGRIFGSTLGVTGNFDVNTNKFTVAGATGNTVIAGTCDITGATEVTGVATLGDGSTLKTNAAPTAGSAEIANAKYVDDQVIAATDADQATHSSDITLTTTYQTVATISSFVAGGNDILINAHAAFSGGTGNSAILAIFIGSTEKATNQGQCSGALGGISVTWLEKSQAGTVDIVLKAKEQVGSAAVLEGGTYAAVINVIKLPSSN